MIDLQRLDIVDRETAEAVLQLQQVAYRIEAELIGSDGIPPLWETIEDLRTCGEEFLGVTVNGALVGAISWRYSAGTIDIHRLVVEPEHFRPRHRNRTRPRRARNRAHSQTRNRSNRRAERTRRRPLPARRLRTDRGA